MNQDEFKLGEWTFRFPKMKTTKMLVLIELLSSKKSEDKEVCYDTILSNVEINLEGTFSPLMNKGIIFPTILEDRIDILQGIYLKFLEGLNKVFKKSNELSK